MTTKGKTRNYNSTYNLASTVSFGVKVSVNNSDYGCVVRILVGPSYDCTGNQRQRAIEQWRPTARQKRLYLHHQGEFQHNYYTFV